MRRWILLGVLIGAVAVAIGAYLVPEERDTSITRDVLAEEIRRTANELGPLVNDFRK